MKTVPGSSHCPIRYRRTIQTLIVAEVEVLRVVVVGGFVVGLEPIVVMQVHALLATVAGLLVARLVIHGGIVSDACC